MAWRTESLGDFYTRAAVAAIDLGEDIVSDLSDYATKRTQFHTPISNMWTKTAGREPGTLRASVQKSSIKHIHGLVVGGVESHDPVAEDIEFGTGLWGPRGQKYVILPLTARSLRFSVVSARSIKTRRVTRSGWVQTKVVMHPGSPGQHMFLNGIMDTELAAARIMEKRMRIWERELRVLKSDSVTRTFDSLTKFRFRRGGSGHRRPL